MAGLKIKTMLLIEKLRKASVENPEITVGAEREVPLSFETCFKVSGAVADSNWNTRFAERIKGIFVLSSSVPRKLC
jgi:hypothetical protein